jgi:hypothetical protein
MPLKVPVDVVEVIGHLLSSIQRLLLTVVQNNNQLYFAPNGLRQERGDYHQVGSQL